MNEGDLDYWLRIVFAAACLEGAWLWLAIILQPPLWELGIVAFLIALIIGAVAAVIHVRRHPSQ